MTRSELSQNDDRKFEIAYRPEDIRRFPSDSEDGPVIGFLHRLDKSVRLVTIEHTIVTHPALEENGQLPAFRLSEPTELVYTPEEWVAFYMGARAGDFNDMYNNNTYNLIRDSKDTNGTVLAVRGDSWRPFMDAVIGGKYDLPRRQERRIFAKLLRQQSR